MTDQLAFSQLLIEADERANARRDLHRGRVQTWFDSLPEEKKAPPQPVHDRARVGHVFGLVGRRLRSRSWPQRSLIRCRREVGRGANQPVRQGPVFFLEAGN